YCAKLERDLKDCGLSDSKVVIVPVEIGDGSAAVIYGDFPLAQLLHTVENTRDDCFVDREPMRGEQRGMVFENRFDRRRPGVLAEHEAMNPANVRLTNELVDRRVDQDGGRVDAGLVREHAFADDRLVRL